MNVMTFTTKRLQVEREVERLLQKFDFHRRMGGKATDAEALAALLPEPLRVETLANAVFFRSNGTAVTDLEAVKEAVVDHLTFDQIEKALLGKC